MWRPAWLTTDRIVGCAFCLLAIALVTIINPNQIATPRISLGGGSSVGLSPQFFPNLLAAVIGLLGILLTVRGRGREESLSAGEGFTLKVAQWVRVAKILATLFVYLLVLPYLGFLIATPLCLVVLMLQLGSRRWFLMVTIASATTAVIHVTFRYGLQVLLPEAKLF